MALDPRNLRPADVTRLLNSSPLGSVIDERHLYRQRMRAGFRIGDGKRVDFIRYLGWMLSNQHAPQVPAQPKQSYAEKKEAAREREANRARSGRDIAPLPTVVNPERKNNCASDYKLFCTTYFPQTFHLPFSPDHHRVIDKIEKAVLHGGLFALAMSRGCGKSSLAENACLWAMLYGHRDFVCLIGSDEGHAVSMLESIKTELECNDLLAEDFPEVTYPIRKLEGIANRCSGQLFQGERTQISWTANEIILPTLADSKASGAIIRVAGLTGRIRGMKHKKVSGETIRPSLVVLDDPQTDISAQSLSQCANRERILAGAVLGLAGPGKKIAGIMPCTVIRPGDMADRILDRELHPEWNGERTKMLEHFPTNTKLWDQYATIRADALRAYGTIADATAFYQKNQATMDAGAKVSWAERFNPDEISAIQHAMNLHLQDPQAFAAEYQNDPLPDDEGHDDHLSVEDVAQKLNGFARRRIPVEAEHLTAFIDVQGKLLYWVVCAWAPNFTGWIIDYGAEPEQRSEYFSLRAADPTLQSAAPHAGFEGSLQTGLERLTDQLMHQPWKREDGAPLAINRCIIDANWGSSTDIVYQFCRSTSHSGIIIPSHGRYVGASSLPFAEYKRKPGDRVGHHWRIPSLAGKRTIRHAIYDTNYWKSFIEARLRCVLGDPGCLSLYGKDPRRHQMFAEHCTAEFHVRTEGRGRTVDEWKIRPDKSDNHLWDCLVGCAVGASMEGVQLGNVRHLPNKGALKQKRLKLSQIQRNK